MAGNAATAGPQNRSVVMAAVLERVRTVLPGKSPNESQSDDPIAELALLEQRRVEIVRHHDRVCEALASIPKRESDAYSAFDDACKNGDPEAIAAALSKWALLVAQREYALRQRAVVVHFDQLAGLIVNADHRVMCAAIVFCVFDCVTDFQIPQPTKWQRIRNQIDAARARTA
jgi:ribosomal protein L14